MNGLVLEGGGVKGAYQVGAYIALKKAGIEFDGIVGASIGAFNGALFASGKEKEAKEFWENVNVAELLDFDPEYVKELNKDHLSLKMVSMIIKKGFSLINNRGLKTDKLLDAVNHYLDEDALMKSNTDFGLMTVRFNDLKHLELWKKDFEQGKLKEYILASCYLPVFKEEKLIDGNYYIDGGFYDNIPTNMLIKKGYKNIYIIRVFGIGFSKKQLPFDGNITVIAPKRSVGRTLTFNSSILKEDIKMGFYDAIRVIYHFDGYHYVINKKSIKYYEFITRKIEDRDYRRVKNFFGTKTRKSTTIKAIEYVLRKEGIDYYQVYDIKKLIKLIQKNYHKDHFIYNYVNHLKFVFFS